MPLINILLFVVLFILIPIFTLILVIKNKQAEDEIIRKYMSQDVGRKKIK